MPVWEMFYLYPFCSVGWGWHRSRIACYRANDQANKKSAICYKITQ